MRFCANVSILFKEAPFLERFGRAKRAGFSAVEFWWPSDEDLGEVEAAIGDAGLSVALFNFDAGDMPAGTGVYSATLRGRSGSGRTCRWRWSWRGGLAAASSTPWWDRRYPA